MSKPVPDWLGCGRVITTESWERFLAAQNDYYATHCDAKCLSLPVGHEDCGCKACHRDVAEGLKTS